MVNIGLAVTTVNCYHRVVFKIYMYYIMLVFNDICLQVSYAEGMYVIKTLTNLQF